MTTKKIFFLLTFSFYLVFSSIADEGMWIPILLEKYNIKDMQEKGLKLSAEDIYSINQACLKDAIMIFGRGCTAELISDKGLIITNHHCGFSQIQEHSSVEHDYLTDGFWAMSQKEELSNPDLTVKFLVRMEDVSEIILKDVDDTMTEAKRAEIINESITKEIEKATKENNYNAIIKPFYYGNEYYMFIYEEFADVRLVGAPPSSIGKFGGDTDNWMWPRHTGDFSLFRIYVDKDNKPAKYSTDNVPYKPKKHLSISVKGVKKDDFTFVFGYPGRTSEYLTSYAVKQISEVDNPHQIKLREKKLEILKTDMNKSALVRIQYASKHARVANYWKKWIGENRGLLKLNAIEKKKLVESDFQAWANSSLDRKQYSGLLKEYKDIYEIISPYQLAENYIYEAAYAIDAIRFGFKFKTLERLVSNNASEEDINKEIEKVKSAANAFFKDYNKPTDIKVFGALMKMYESNLEQNYYPDFFNQVDKKYKGDYTAFAQKTFDKSMLLNQDKLNSFLANFSAKQFEKIQNDPVYSLFKSVNNLYRGSIYSVLREYNQQIDSLNRYYMSGLREMYKDQVFYPDANFTLRIAYGKVDDYYPRDAVYYNYYTTLKGIIEKEDADVADYVVPEKLKELYNNKDFGTYAENDTMHVCFTASNHTTGGNSGSPVLNAEGHLIGINFDRNWEGTMSDIMYDPDQCRNITLDIRYALFIIDKFAGATHLIEEMTLIK